MTSASSRAEIPSPPGLGKIILLGEHAVVYGHKALAGAIDRGLRCRAESTPGRASRLTIPDWQIDVSLGDTHPVAEAFAALLEAAGRSDVHLRAEADLPPAAGLGSSAALSVGVARALRPELADSSLVDLANAGERRFHERPSGIDVALSCRGGIGVFCKKTGLQPLRCPALPLVVALSGVPRSTADMVAAVRERVAGSDDGQACLERISATAEAGEEALMAGDLAALGGLMSECHQILCEIGVSIPALDAMVQTAGAAGALGAKLTGAGGGGAIIALAPGNEDTVRDALLGAGYHAFVTTLGAMP